MKTSLVALSALLTLACGLLAQPAPKPAAAAPEVTNKQAAPKAAKTIDPAARSNMLAKTGGFIQSAASGPVLLFLDTQKQIPETSLREVSDQIKRNVRLPCAVAKKLSAEPVAAAIKALADTNTAAVIVIGDAPGYPSLLIAPENRWALVNVAALSGAGVTADQLTERVQKETWRAFGYLMGAANSNFESCLLKPVFSTGDLDDLKLKTLCPEPFGKILIHSQKMGMQPTRMSTYRKAAEEGWAPAPTNDFQRAIWDEIKKTPAK